MSKSQRSTHIHTHKHTLVCRRTDWTNVSDSLCHHGCVDSGNVKGRNEQQFQQTSKHGTDRQTETPAFQHHQRQVGNRRLFAEQTSKHHFSQEYQNNNLGEQRHHNTNNLGKNGNENWLCDLYTRTSRAVSGMHKTRQPVYFCGTLTSHKIKKRRPPTIAKIAPEQ